MKKLYLSEMDDEKLLYLLKLNSKLEQRFAEYLIEDLMFQQEEETKLTLGDNFYKYIEVRNHYDSWFFILKDYRKFLTNIDKDYLTTEEEELYNKLIDKLDTLDQLDCYSKNYDDLDNWLEENSKKLLELIEKDLHEYEDYPSIEDILQYNKEMEQLNDYYIEVQDDGFTDNVVRLDVAYTETFI